MNKITRLSQLFLHCLSAGFTSIGPCSSGTENKPHNLDRGSAFFVYRSEHQSSRWEDKERDTVLNIVLRDQKDPVEKNVFYCGH